MLKMLNTRLRGSARLCHLKLNQVVVSNILQQLLRCNLHKLVWQSVRPRDWASNLKQVQNLEETSDQTVAAREFREKETAPQENEKVHN